MSQQKKTTIHGIEIQQTQLQGKWYTPVDARVKIAEQADPALIRRPGAGYHVVLIQILQIADKWAYHCMVEYPIGSGVLMPGTDFIDTKDPSGVAKAETSAIGRALGLHGIATEESIASAEEMSRVTTDADNDRQPTPQLRQQPASPPQTQEHRAAPQRQPAPSQRDAGRTTDGPAAEVDTINPPSEMQAKAIARLCAELHHPTPVFTTYTEASRLITKLTAEWKAAQAAAAAEAARNPDALREAFPAGVRGA